MSRKPRLLDLFCKAGGAGMGYYRAGFEVVGVDLEPQPRYPFEFVQGDALTFPLDGFDAVHASPPCQGYSSLKSHTGREYESAALLPAMLGRLAASGLPYIVENVVGSGPVMGNALTLCGSSFGLKVRRHRHFVTSFACLAPPCHHAAQREVVGVYGHPGGRSTRDGERHSTDQWREAMGIDWMTAAELAQAIPPAFTEYLGEQLLTALDAAA